MMRAQLVSTHSGPSLAARSVGLAGKAWHAFWRWRARRATVELLEGLDDRTLHDIGVSRTEITSLVYGRRGDRRRVYEEAWRRPWAT
ncbi:MAG TPA: DUF1127 domain-containing protein [Hyphomicrobiaceae bacterium]|nr:DUF1127 domain-containing protein [Hyphomicrobiaceae bacterium]